MFIRSPEGMEMVPRFTSTTFIGWARHLLTGTCVTVMAALAAAQGCPPEVKYRVDASFDHVMPLSPILEVTSASHVTCAQACLAHAQCGTFAYNAANGSCAGMPTHTPNQAEMTSARGFRLYKLVFPCPTDQGYVYNWTLQLCLMFHTDTQLNCYGSENYCTSLGDQLAILRTPEEINFAIGQVARFGSDWFITGAKAFYGHWSWQDGSPVEDAVLSMVDFSVGWYDCLIVTGNGLRSMWTTNNRYIICRRDVTDF